MLRAVLFDLDGVLTDTAEYHYLAWKELATELGIEIDRAFNERLKGVSRMASLERILLHGGRADDYTMEEKRALAAKKNAQYVALLARLTPADLYPGIAKLLNELRVAGIYTVLASASKNAPQIMEALGITDHFNYIVDPDEVPAGKPAPDIFLRGAAAVGVAPEACIGIEDAQAGIEAIKSAGMIAIGIGDAALLRASGADRVLAGTEQLTLSFLRSLM